MKKWNLAWVMALALLLAVPQMNAQSEIPAAINNPGRVSLFEALPVHKNHIVMLGNSITHGGLWSELFDNKHVINRGIGADKTYDVLRRLDPIIKGQPKKVFILIGTNDLPLSGIGSVDQTFARYRQIVDRFLKESPRTKIYVQSVMPVNGVDFDNNFRNRHHAKGKEILELNAKLKAMCTELGLTYIDLFPALADERGLLRKEFSYDGLHLLGPGYLAWTTVLKPYVK